MLTRSDGTLDVTRQSALVDQIADLRRAGLEVVLVSSGAVAAGRSEFSRAMAAGLDDLSARQLFSAVGQVKLINRYYDFFREHGMHCGQVLATKENFACRSHYLNQRHCLSTMLANGVVPVMNENDTVSVTELMFTDNDELSGLIATMIDADRLIILSNIDGLFTGDPADPASRLIPRVEPGQDPTAGISANKSSLGRGGMSSKCRIARRVAAEGIEVVIANGKREGILRSVMALEGAREQPHTLFVAADRPTSQLKKWIAHSDAFSKGSLRVNRGAIDALKDRQGVSLLPVGVTEVEGDFDAGDIVMVRDPEGAVVAWGRTTAGAAEAAAMCGTPGLKPIIHADYLYIDETNIFRDND